MPAEDAARYTRREAMDAAEAVNEVTKCVTRREK